MASRGRRGSPEAYRDISDLIALVRGGRATTRPELARVSNLGRNVVSGQLRTASDLGLLEAAGAAPSSGGRAPERWRFRGERGIVLVACMGAASMSVALLDLSDRVLAKRHVEWMINEGPEATLARVHQEFQELLADRHPSDLWGIGLGLPGPIEQLTGRPAAPPIMPGWDGFDIRGWFAQRYDVGVWVDNDANVMALGYVALTHGPSNLIYVKVGTGIGAGIVSGGRLHRGDQGCAGDIGHVRVSDRTDVVCRCGRMGCLEAYAGGWALERDAITAQVEGRSPYLTEVVRRNGRITPADIGRGCLLAEPTCVELTSKAAALIGNVLSVLVNFFNPAQILLGGGVIVVGPLFISTVDRVIRERSVGLATERLGVSLGHPEQIEGVVGCGRMVVDALLQPEFLAEWVPERSPHGVDTIIHRKAQDEAGG